MRRLFHAAAAITWAISPAWLTTILTIANGEGTGPEAVAKELGRPLDNTHDVEMRNGVAIVPVIGPVFRRASWFGDVSGATSVSVLATDFNLALDNDDVSAILLNIDSPGGEANGISELADMIYAARGRKQIVAYVGGCGASAAYWLASACDKIYVSETAEVGSIGCVRAVPDPRGKNADGSAKAIEIVSSQSPNKRPDVTTDDGRAVFQAEVDDMAAVFVRHVARNRGVGEDVVLERFGGGACFIGAKAVAAGMVDAVSSFEAVIASLAPRAQASAPQPMAAAVISHLKAPAIAVAASKPQESRPMAKALIALATVASLASPGGVRADDAPPDDKKKDDMRADDAPAEGSGPKYAVDDTVMAGDRPATVTEVRNGPHYAIQYTDDQGGDFQWASEDELAAAAGGDEGGGDPTADDPADESPAAVALRASRAENRRLRAALAGATKTSKKTSAETLIARMKADKKWTPALETVVRTVAARPVTAMQALEGMLAVMPVIAPTASVNRPPTRKTGSEPVSLTYNGKSYGELSMGEKHQLAHSDKDLFDQMKMAHDAANAKS
jgi:ClpP class serine protease